ncbi:MAG: type II toxin-antitoxin system YafQ family toxin, partial [Candidatus Electrothrix sp. ATG2]|nr:type II toxin-antitoxin system YafQ family toxin [Candidatus Electrothrix sp. ATG2]
GGDFLLINRIEESGKYDLVVFVRAGTRSELFE